MTYKARQMPRRFMECAPPIVKARVLDITSINPAAPLDFDIVLREPVTDNESGDSYGFNGVDFGVYGERGCHFFLKPHEMRAYRDRNRRKRVAWRDMPEATQKAIVAYLEWNPEESTGTGV
jgi:hypothetical protein